MSFCVSIEGVAEVTRFRRMLSRGPKILSFSQKNYGTWIAPRKETLEVILNSHFLNSVDPDSYPLGAAGPFCNAGMVPGLRGDNYQG